MTGGATDVDTATEITCEFWLCNEVVDRTAGGTSYEGRYYCQRHYEMAAGIPTNWRGDRA